jgi:cell division protein FtsB
LFFYSSEPELMNFKPRLSHTWMLYGCAILLLLLLFHAIVGERGAIHLWRLQGERARLDEQNYRLQFENRVLRQKIRRLRNDDFYLEKIAREELNLLRPGEVIYRFPSAEQRQKARDLSVRASESPPSAARKSPR